MHSARSPMFFIARQAAATLAGLGRTSTISTSDRSTGPEVYQPDAAGSPRATARYNASMSQRDARAPR